ncbi:MAG: hypothetical protein QG673_1969 [Pseudomonadota bacterium]|nr:hypothetical protein [Pseudomonadota bacterium]
MAHVVIISYVFNSINTQFRIINTANLGGGNQNERCWSYSGDINITSVTKLAVMLVDGVEAVAMLRKNNII